MSDDGGTKVTGLALARKIDDFYFEDECTLGIVYGGFLGTGKSAYCIKSEADAFGSHPGYEDNVPNYEKVKQFLDFPPKDFVARLLSLKRREKCTIWDDMGLWLFVLDWYDPFVKAVCKYLNVMRTDWGMLLGNTPTPKMVASKIQYFPELIRVKVSKATGNKNDPRRPRIATGYQVWYAPDMKKTGVRRIFQDKYFAMMPDDFFGWYKPLRDHYAQVAKQLMYSELQKLHRKDKEEVVEDGFKNVLPEPERVHELSEIISQLEVGDRF